MEIAVGGERLYSHNLRDFLRIKEEDHQRNLNQTTSSSSGGGGRHNNTTGLTLSAVLSEKISQPPPEEAPPLQRVQSNRTLLDIIREDQITGLGRGQDDGRSSWQHLKDRIRLRRRGGAAAVWSSSLHIPSSDVPQNNNRRVNLNVDSSESTQPDVRGPSSLTRATSERFEQTSSLPTRRSITEFNNQHENHEEEAEERRGGDAVEAEAEGSQPARTSLMALLAENDRQNGYESSAYLMDEDEGDVEAETGGSGGDTAVKGGEYNSCCVCMVRHKGAAFIPCGHTFCRLCSRELWVQRGNCPLCNNYILEILDIF